MDVNIQAVQKYRSISFRQRLSQYKRKIEFYKQIYDDDQPCIIIMDINSVNMESQLLTEKSKGTLVIDQAQHQYSQAEKMLDRVDGEGRFQLYSFLVFFFLWFFTSWLLLGMSFFFDDAYTCVKPEFANKKDCQKHICTLPSSQRKSQIATHSASITFQFQDYMICSDYENQIPILQSMIFFGALIGFFFIPTIADNSGRKEGLKIAMIIGIIGSILLSIADSPKVTGFALFFIGFGTNPAITLAFSFINEQCLGKSRQRFGVGVQIGLALGETLIALIFLTGLTWREIMYMLIGFFMMTYIAIELILKETPLYLIEKNPQQTLKVLNEMAKINNKEPISSQQFELIRPKDLQKEQNAKVGVFDLLRYKSLRWISISTGFIFFGIQVIYYSTTLNLDGIGFSKTINQMIFGLSQMSGYIAAQFIIHKSLRKKSSYLGLGLASAMCLVLGILLLFNQEGSQSTFAWIQAAGLVINRFILCAFWSIFYVYVAELFPTEVRSLGYGWTSVLGMIGSTASPYISLISSLIGVNSWFPPAVLGLISCLFIHKLPETFGKSLKDKIEEHTQQHKKSESLIDP